MGDGAAFAETDLSHSDVFGPQIDFDIGLGHGRLERGRDGIKDRLEGLFECLRLRHSWLCVKPPS